MHTWLLLITSALRVDGLLTIDAANRERIATWVTDMFSKKVDFETILHILAGDAFFEQNKSDVAKLEAEAGRRVTTLWDTDPIFARYPHLRTLGRNKEFEKMWAKMRADAKQKQK